ncbi:MAG: hypothetical protein II999_05680 [Bacteroidaceae bacterium]|nr:hypothetical protein [Bacteroidaceae bacterium]
MDKKLERAITYILRYAIAEGGRAYYNPCMYNLGFADNIPPSDEFNRELCKFGRVHYERYFDYEMDEFYYDDAWDYFEINENGRNFIVQKERKMNGPLGLFKILRYISSAIFTIIQFVCVIEGWISYFLNLILKSISSILFFLSIISFVWWPLDMLCAFIWMGCDYIKHKIWDKGFKWEASSKRWINHFPEL